MSLTHWVAGFLVFGGVGVQVASCIGLVVARDSFDRLHLVAPATVLGAVMICTAVALNDTFSQGGIHAIVTGCLLLAAGPVLTHATGQAIRLRDTGHVPVLPSEARQAHEDAEQV